MHQASGDIERRASDAFLAVLDYHLVDPYFGRDPTATEADRAAGVRLQAQGGDLEHVSDRARHAAVGHRQHLQLRVDGAQMLDEAFQTREVAFVFIAVNDRFDGGAAAPEIGATQSADACDFHRR